MADKKSPKRELLETLKNGYDRVSDAVKADINTFAEDYREFMNECKTERECVNWSISIAERHGFRPLRRGMSLKAGDKVYANNRGKALLLAVIGEKAPSEGTRIAAAHVDAPRIDLKTNPLYEDSELAYFKTHYYGGIKKYHWVNIPLELRGVVALKNGSTVNVAFGTNDDEPALVITDILPHLAAEQMKKTMSEGIAGESLNVLLGSVPASDDDGADRVKLAVMGILNDLYGITEGDLHSAELSLVPSFKARDIGFDRSMLGAYGHDDRVCSYDILRALFDLETAPEFTAVGVLADKEEIGSEGVSGMKSAFFDTFMEDICEAFGSKLRVCYENSMCLSCDVNSAFDPNWTQPFDKRNTAKINYGIGITKFTGSRGKAGASDASAELVARIRQMFDGNDVVWQMGPLGAVDAGGGGTVAAYMANRNIDTIDAGVPVLSMHAPWEIVSKLDVYMAYRGVWVFFVSK